MPNAARECNSPPDGPESAGLTGDIGAIGRQINPKAVRAGFRRLQIRLSSAN
jgi:hypothetical protein